MEDYKVYSPGYENRLDRSCLDPKKKTFLKKSRIDKNEPFELRQKFIPDVCYRPRNLEESLETIALTDSPHNLREATLGAIQLYFDGLIRDLGAGKDPAIWAEQSQTLQSMIDGLRIAIEEEHDRDEMKYFEKLRGKILPHREQILRDGSREVSKFRHLGGKIKKVNRLAELAREILAQNKPDLIIPVASGGFEPAAEIANHLGVERIMPIRYSRVSRGDYGVRLPFDAPEKYAFEQISGKRVLIVEDIVASGYTAEFVVDWTNKHNPAEVHFAYVLGGSDRLKRLRINGKLISPSISEFQEMKDSVLKRKTAGQGLLSLFNIFMNGAKDL